jgi:hypothetical protein
VGGDAGDAVSIGRAAERIREATALDAPSRRAMSALLGLVDHSGDEPTDQPAVPPTDEAAGQPTEVAV